MTARVRRSALFTVVALTAAAVAAPARTAAAQPVALPRFHPSFAGDRFWGTPSPYAAGDFTFHAALFADLARRPLLERRVTDNVPVAAVVRSQIFLHANATLSLWSRVAVNVDVPVAVQQSGDVTASPRSAAFGDLRVGLRGAILGDAGSPFQLGVGGYLWAPTGTDDFVTDRTVRGLPFAVAGGRIDRIVWSLAAGAELRAERVVNRTAIGPAFWSSAAAGVALGETHNIQLGLEATLSVALRQATWSNTGAELLGQVRYRFHPDLEVAAGLGPGLTPGVGTPEYRALIGLAYTPQIVPGLRDADHDGVIDRLDACSRAAGPPNSDPARNGCPLQKPPLDTDGDGIPDSQDACPRTPGVPSGDASLQGCPLSARPPYVAPDSQPGESGKPNE